MASANESESVHATMYFLQRSSIYDEEKPYSLRFPPGDGLAQSNILREAHLIQVASMRGRSDLRLETCGFEVMAFSSPLSYEDYEDANKIAHVLLPALCRKLKQHLSAQHVVALDFSVRRRHASFPVSTGKDYDHDQPTNMAHIDFTPEEGERMLRVMYPDQADEIIAGDWYSTWFPLRGPLNDWPLAICDARTVDREADLMPGDIVYTDWATENLQVHHSDRHKWYYLPDQTVDEVLIFKSGESSSAKVQAVPHGSFYNPRVQAGEPPRESIDSRFFVLFAPLEKYPRVQGNVFSQRPD
ncbi:uncharacterized protein THITE_2088932 [Thermothielavioides terrestris NRRL 8126]|uniref:CmcJ-like methyltransferase n=1 Tax=Thermothielavioides terrestris (strain ATCC 38088 / NRRL 8126) TaxID=578455 RepID=G2R5F3_THETT|nr:uncharacterized protein THITE_2088932 [Thermothielavioides terrestris NRRL 8126]AEO67444.1 hypothetical protein THITE_2088932 [Thermothielavioides terrestris NRRL 8126]